MSFILFLLFFVLIIGLFILLAVFGFVRKVLRFGQKARNLGDEQAQSHTQTNKNSKKSKVFEKTEGEYVDYEEVKD